jgi:hypothetical protein
MQYSIAICTHVIIMCIAEWTTAACVCQVLKVTASMHIFTFWIPYIPAHKITCVMRFSWWNEHSLQQIGELAKCLSMTVNTIEQKKPGPDYFKKYQTTTTFCLASVSQFMSLKKECFLTCHKIDQFNFQIIYACK